MAILKHKDQMEEKKYINIDNMAIRLCQILKDARESMVDDKNKDFVMENFSDKYLEDESFCNGNGSY